MKAVSLICLAALPAWMPVSADEDLSWITGSWCRDEGRAQVQEVWLPTDGDTRLGINQTTAGGRTVAFEFLRIETRGGTIRYLPQVNGAAPVSFQLAASGENWARFENPEHDFPQRIEYRRVGKQLQAEIAGPGEDGGEMVIPMPFSQCQD